MLKCKGDVNGRLTLLWRGSRWRQPRQFHQGIPFRGYLLEGFFVNGLLACKNTFILLLKTVVTLTTRNSILRPKSTAAWSAIAMQVFDGAPNRSGREDCWTFSCRLSHCDGRVGRPQLRSDSDGHLDLCRRHRMVMRKFSGNDHDHGIYRKRTRTHSPNGESNAKWLQIWKGGLEIKLSYGMIFNIRQFRVNKVVVQNAGLPWWTAPRKETRASNSFDIRFYSGWYYVRVASELNSQRPPIEPVSKIL